MIIPNEMASLLPPVASNALTPRRQRSGGMTARLAIEIFSLPVPPQPRTPMPFS